MFHLAALLSTRAEFTPTTAHHVNVEGTLNLLEFAQQRRRVARPRGRVRLPVVDRRIRPAGPRHQDAAPAASGKTTTCIPTTMYGCNKLYCEQLGPLLRAALQATGGEYGGAPRRFPERPVSRSDLGDDDAGGRHVGLRVGDDSRGRQGRAATRASSARTPGFRSWRCPMRSTRLLALAQAPRDALTKTAYNLAAFSPSAAEIRDVVLRAFPAADDRLRRGREAPGDRRFVAHRRRRFGGARRLALSSAVRPRAARSATT